MLIFSLPYPAFVGPGPELITNGTFTTNSTGWTNFNATNAVSTGKVTVTTTALTGGIDQSFSTVSGGTYTVTYNATNGTGTASISIANSQANLGGANAIASGQASSTTFTFVATASTTFIGLMVSGKNGGTGDFDNISVKRTA